MRKLKISALLWFVLLWGYSFLFGGLIVSNKILLYLHPKMLPYAFFASVVLFVLGIVQLINWYRAKHVAKLSFGHALFTFPIVLLLIVSPEQLSVEIAQSKGAYVVSQPLSIGVDKNTLEEKKYTDNEEAEDVDLSAYEFQKTVWQYFLDPTDLVDETLVLEGFVAPYHDDDENTFLLARIIITCCAADAQTIGFKSVWIGETAIQEGDWVRVEGVLRETGIEDEVSFDSNGTHVFEILNVEIIDAPENPYIYP